MRLVASLLQHAQRRRATRKTQRFRVAEDEDLLLALRQADDRHRPEPDGVESRMRRVELSFASVDQHQVGQRLLFLAAPREVPADDFMHRCEIIDTLDGLDLEFAILGAVRSPVLKPNTRRDGVSTLRVRDVETHERSGNFLEAEVAMQLGDRISGALLRLVSGETKLLEKVPRVLRREINELAARAPLRHVNCRSLERRFDQLAIFGLEGDEQLAGAVFERQVASRQVRLKDGWIRFLLEIPEGVILAGH